jgi:adenine phosphoribosyltransferase
MADTARQRDDRLAAIDAAIRIIADFPKPGIQFRDITPLIADPARFADVVAMMADRVRALSPDAIVAVEARGFLFGAPLALALGLPLVPVRKPGKLPGETHMIAYGLEYGSDQLELHVDALGVGHRAVIVDDLLATGGTVAAAADLVWRTGAHVAGAIFLCELAELGGRARLEAADVAVDTLLTY